MAPAYAIFFQRVNKSRIYRVDFPTDMDSLRELAQDPQRSFMATWGYDNPEIGPPTCFERQRGLTYGGRQLEELWREYDPDHSTGYFLEHYREDDPDTDCRHGIPVNDPDYGCVYQFLADGPKGMPTDPGGCGDPFQ